jgi:hypothetical protein
MWLYNKEELTDENIPKDAIGFIYLITNMTNGRMYVGKKLLTKAGTKQVNGKKKKIRKESDWRDYYSSSPELKADVSLLGKDKFRREILYFSFSLAVHNYLEEKEQFLRGVLEKDLYYNSNIRAKIFKKNIIGKIGKQ